MENFRESLFVNKMSDDVSVDDFQLNSNAYIPNGVNMSQMFEPAPPTNNEACKRNCNYTQQKDELLAEACKKFAKMFSMEWAQVYHLSEEN